MAHSNKKPPGPPKHLFGNGPVRARVSDRYINVGVWNLLEAEFVATHHLHWRNAFFTCCFTCSGETISVPQKPSFPLLLYTFTDNTLIKPSHDHSLAMPLFAPPNILAEVLAGERAPIVSGDAPSATTGRFSCGKLACSAAKRTGFDYVSFADGD